MALAAPAKPAGRRTLAVAVGALTVTQMVGWGTTFHIPAVLSARISAGTGLSRAIVFGGVTLMLLVAAAISPAVGRLLDRDGARRWMAIGSLLTASGLLIMSTATGPLVFGLAWLVFGFAMPLALNQGASTALVHIAPDRARGAIAVLLLISGFSSTIAWPVLIGLDEALGWRACLVVCAGFNLLICLPLHLFGLPRGRMLVDRSLVGPAPAEAASQPPPAPGMFTLAAITFSLAGMLTWGLPLHMIGILEGFGHSEAVAVSIGALLGAGQVLARGFEMLGGHRFGILAVGVGSAALMPVALVVLWAWGASWPGALVFVIGYGMSAGLISIVRAVAPLRLFGAAAYATVLGRLGLPQNIAFAAAPLGFAVLLDQFGVGPVVWTAFAIGLVCLVTMIELARRAPAG